MGAWGASGGSSILPTPTQLTVNEKYIRMEIFKRFILLYKKDKLLFFSIISTLPTVLIWLFGLISYIWNIIYTYLILNLNSTEQMGIFLITPFIAANLAFLSYIKNKILFSKLIFITNIFFVILVLIASFVFDG